MTEPRKISKATKTAEEVDGGALGVEPARAAHSARTGQTTTVGRAARAGAVQVPAAVSAWVARLAYGVVCAWNVLCAVQFIGWPGDYVAAYQLSGPAGEAALRGLGVAFLMWNVTYPLFLWKPAQQRVLGALIIVQQVIGLAGEIVIASGLPTGFDMLTDSIARFVGFDALGLLLMACAYLLLFRKSSA